MPEYPEIHTYITLLKPRIEGLEIANIEIEREKSVNLPVAEMKRSIEHQRMVAVTSRGKHILFKLSNERTILVHLMLGGWMFFSTDEEAPKRSKQVILSFAERREKLFFINLRLGYFHLLTPDELENKLAMLGHEALDSRLDLEHFADRLRKKRGSLKAFFLDQKQIAGIGNAYSDEICFEAAIQPERKTAELTSAEIEKLFDAMRNILKEGAKYGGYMDFPFYPGDSLTGGFNPRFKVYGRLDQPCLRCGATIQRHELSGRKSYSCPNCQT